MILGPCEWPEEHECGKVVAKIGLPGPDGIWVCLNAFNIWRKEREPDNYK